MASKNDGDKRMSVERIYQKKTQLEHILLRPDTYIGSVEFETQISGCFIIGTQLKFEDGSKCMVFTQQPLDMWVWDGDETGLIYRKVTYVPGLYKIFDEILVNAADNKQRSSKMDTLKVDIDQENNTISIYNNGSGIPVVQHKVEKIFVPSLIFGHLLTSSNYNDEEKKVTGGRNGYGAKLCNIFSTKFTVETACKQSGKVFKQTWRNNMTETQDPIIKPLKGDEYTCITFCPDLKKFKMEILERDMVAIMSRRAYDVAGSSVGIKVYLNGKRIPIKNFKDYVDWYIKDKVDDQGNPVKVAYEKPHDRWEIAVTTSDKGLQQVSFVNSIATIKGGRHVDYVLDQVVTKILEVVKKKSKKDGIAVRPFQIKNHIWIFVNCLIENPTFDSQTKENMTLQAKSFGSKFALSEKFSTAVQKGGIVDSVMAWVHFKSQTELNKKCGSRTLSKLKNLPKLEDANDAGTKHGIDCTLILTEGDSAKSLAVAGLSVLGRDKFGVFPLKGKVLNVREATAKQILENQEINNIIKIMGLQYKRKYETREDMQTLRYGRLMIMTDQDQDGSHIKGLLINFIHHNWPNLLRTSFLEEFITPIVKVTKGNKTLSFYSLPEFEEWKQATDDWNRWTTKYYKGLGTSTSAEGKEYFSDLDRHRIKFKYTGPDDDNSIQLAFSKKMVEQRKEWLTNGMEERKRRRELGLSEVYLYGKQTKAITYQDFVNKELILFSNMDNERSIPSLVDGLKPGMRKVMFACFKKLKKETKVAQLAAAVGKCSAYHHGETSLMSTIINLAQNFVGSNNINILLPIGQFGTRLLGGKDAASPRYINTKLSPLTNHIFNKADEPLLNFLFDDNQKIEPEWYIPIIPMILVNGADGIGTGWMTKIPNYNPREIVENLRRLMRGEECRPMLPWYKNFRGTVIQVEPQRFLTLGEAALLDEKSFEITELPIKTWTSPYKESVIEVVLHGSDKIPSLIVDYKDYSTDTNVRFVITMAEDRLDKVEQEGIHKVFKLTSSLNTTSMVLFDQNGCLRKYDTVDDILKEFYTLRFEFYVKRKNYMEGFLSAQLQQLSNQARFILEKINKELDIENKSKAAILSELVVRKFDPDPIKKWKASQKLNDEEGSDSDTAADETEEDEEEDERDSKSDYDYLMCMVMWNLSKEKIAKLLAQRDTKAKELAALKKRSPSDLWTSDLDAFVTALDKFENDEREYAAIMNSKLIKNIASKAGGGRGKKVAGNPTDNQPSAYGERVEPKYEHVEVRRKTERAIEGSAGDGPVKGKKIKEDSPNTDSQGDADGNGSSEEVKPLLERIGRKKVPTKPKEKKSALKQTKLEFKPTKSNVKKPKGRNPWSESSDEDVSEDMSSDDDDNYAVDHSDPAAGVAKAARAPKAKPPVTSEPDQSLLFDSLLSDSASPPKTVNNGNSAEEENGKEKIAMESESESEAEEHISDASVSSVKATSKPAKSSTATVPLKASVALPKKKAAPRKRAVLSSDDDSPKRASKKPAPRKPLSKKKNESSDSESQEYNDSPKKKSKTKAPAVSDELDSFDAFPRARSARARPKVSYKFEESDDDDY